MIFIKKLFTKSKNEFFAKNSRVGLSCDNTGCACRVSTFTWVSNDLKCVYVESPKTACTSIKKTLGNDVEIHKNINIMAGATAHLVINNKNADFSAVGLIKHFFIVSIYREKRIFKKKNLFSLKIQ
jgi:hypothetical protein